ncbi:hypothetical protein [Actinocorallia libanotica]|uniref:Uncharacterized protein n=1 Tax=Actinocorallia libanotica TaxID=46162 RepID=A0ABN1REZ8_9ACTN
MASNRRTAASSRARTRAIRRRMAETGESYSRAARVVDALAARPTAAEPQQSPPPPQDQVALAGEVLRYIDAWCGGDWPARRIGTDFGGSGLRLVSVR